MAHYDPVHQSPHLQANTQRTASSCLEHFTAIGYVRFGGSLNKQRTILEVVSLAAAIMF